jgi:FtsP/CotA-like multicopper oxidase with cupredoxin domain
MSRAQRFSFLGIAVVIAVVAVIVIAGSGGDDNSDDAGTNANATATATPTATQEQPEASPQETPTPTPTATPEPPLLKGGKVTRLEYKEGDTVKFRVVSDVPEEVHIHGYNITKDLEPDKEITVTFKATIEGIFEIEYEHAGEQIGELRVEPK